MKRFARTRSEKRDSQPAAGRAQCSVGSIDEDGIRYGLTTQALIASTIATAPTIVTIQSTAMRRRRGSRPVTRSSGWWNSCSRGPSTRPRRAAAAATRTGGAGGGGCSYSFGIRQSPSGRPSAAQRRPSVGTRRSSVSLTTCSPGPERGGVWGTGRLPTLSRRRGLRGRKHGFRFRFRWRPRAVGERCSRDRSHVVASPGLDPAVIAGEQDLGHLPAAKLRRSRVVRILEPAVEGGREALDLTRALGQRTG